MHEYFEIQVETSRYAHQREPTGCDKTNYQIQCHSNWFPESLRSHRSEGTNRHFKEHGRACPDKAIVTLPRGFLAITWLGSRRTTTNFHLGFHCSLCLPRKNGS